VRSRNNFLIASWSLVAWTLVAAPSLAGGVAAEAGSWQLRDKTLVAWVAPANTTQRGGSILTIENIPGQFDALVFGEIEPARWMAGSDFFRRTSQDQASWPAEKENSHQLVQVAVTYRGREISLYRDARPYAHYKMETEPVRFSERSIILLGLRHWEILGSPTFLGEIEDARIYAEALDAPTLARLRPDQADGPRPLAWWTFQDGTTADRMKTFSPGRLVGKASISGGRLHLNGGFLLAGQGIEPPRTRDQEDWPTYHVSALPEEGLCRSYDANGCIYWKGKYHLMYIYQDPNRPHGGHSWGHAVSTDLVNWTFLPPSVVPDPGDPDVGIFSGNAFINKEGVPMRCWFGINAGVCVATAQDDELIHWKKHQRNPIVPIPRPGQPGHGTYTVWDPYLWLEGDTYYCLLGGNSLKNGKDTLYTLRSTDLVNWTPLHPFHEHPDLSWTTPGEDCSCPDFFKLGDKHVLLCISHKVGGRVYVGTFKNEHFYPEQHVRMNWPGEPARRQGPANLLGLGDRPASHHHATVHRLGRPEPAPRSVSRAGWNLEDHAGRGTAIAEAQSSRAEGGEHSRRFRGGDRGRQRRHPGTGRRDRRHRRAGDWPRRPLLAESAGSDRDPLSCGLATTRPRHGTVNTPQGRGIHARSPRHGRHPACRGLPLAPDDGRGASRASSR
jgi:beta-fructofuranosidase